MKQFIRNTVNGLQSRVQSTANVMQWIESGFNIDGIPRQAIDELCKLAKVAEDKSKIAISDLFRLLILKDTQAEYILTQHWAFIKECIIDLLSQQNLSDTEAKTIQNFHQMSLKMLANIFHTA